MIGRLRRFLNLSSPQRRIGILTGVAVAVAVALTGCAGYLTAHLSLYHQLDGELTQIARLSAESIGTDLQTLGGIDDQVLQSANVTMVVLRSDGYQIRIPGDRFMLDIANKEVAVARLQETESHRTGQDSTGQPYRIVAVPMPQVDGRYALVVGRPLAPLLDLLGDMGVVLLLTGVGGVLLGAVTGSLIARSSMHPVRQLTRAVTRVTKTDSLDPIDVQGTDEVSQLTRSFNTMLYSLASSRTRQNRLIADAGHELRTPLTALRTNIELLVADEKSSMLPAGARADILRDIAAQLAEFTSLIGDLVQLTHDPVKATRQPLNLRDVIESALERVRRRGHGIEFDVHLNSLYLLGYPDTLERAVTNLLDNAVKFSPPGGTIRVVLEGDQLRIADQGPGIAEDDLPHIFDRFYRSEKARHTPGTGLGLSIVAQTVARHNGWVRASRAAEGGAEFIVRLPGKRTLEGLQDQLDTAGRAE